MTTVFEEYTPMTLCDIHEECLPMWVVYSNPSDYPGKFVVRRSHIIMSLLEPVVDKDPVVVTGSLALARSRIPPGKVMLTPSSNDDPVILEVWL